MKITKTLPQNAAFFERYADLITSLTKVATIAQLITGLCELGILSALLSKALSDFLAPQYLDFWAFMGAIVCAALLQIGLKKVFPYSVRAILYRRFKGLDLWFSILIFILTIALLVVSIVLSWQGAKDIADLTIKPEAEKTTAYSDSTRNAAIQEAQKLFRSDSTTIETKYNGKAEATTTELMTQVNSIERKGKNATSLRAELKTKLANLQTEKATELEAKATDRNKEISRATNRADSEAQRITEDNSDKKKKEKEKRQRYGGYIGYFTAFCYVFFLVVFALNEIYKKGANITEKPIPSQRHFNPSVIAELMETIKEKLDVFFRTKIQDWANNTPAQPLPNAVSALYDFKADVLSDSIKFETEATTKTKIIKLPLKLPNIAANNNDNESSERQAIPQRQIGFLKPNTAANATAAVKRLPLENSDTTTSVTANVAKQKICLHCGNSYIYKIHNQKFCTESCRVKHWENKTGAKVIKGKK